MSSSSLLVVNSAEVFERSPFFFNEVGRNCKEEYYTTSDKVIYAKRQTEFISYTVISKAQNEQIFSVMGSSM